MSSIVSDTLWNKTRNFLLSEDGPTAVEYAVMLAFIILVCIASVRAVGTQVSNTFAQASVGW